MNRHQLHTLVALLDGTLQFTWTNDEHLMVFSLRRYFLLDKTYVLPMFKAYLNLENAISYKNAERRKCFLDIDIKRDNTEDCIETLNTLTRAIGNAHKDNLFLLLNIILLASFLLILLFLI